MNKIETIIAALEFASDNSDKANFQYHIVEKALAAARELRELKPVAWETFALKFASGQALSYLEPNDLPSYLRYRPLYALDEVTK